MRSCILRCLTECLALRMCWTNALKPTPSPSTRNSPAWWAGKGCVAVPILRLGRAREGSGPGAHRVSSPAWWTQQWGPPRLPRHSVP